MRRTLLLTLILGLVCAAAPRPLGAHDDDVIRFTVDVAEDFDGKFVSTPVGPGDTEPVRGSWFITEGRIFPAGTIRGDGSTFDPTSNTLHPIGTWHCRGSHLISLSEIVQGGHPWATRTERAGEAARERACRGVRGAKPLG